MKKTRNIMAVLLCMLAALFMSGCGGGSDKESSPYEGKWIAVSAQMMGVSVDIEEVFEGEVALEIKPGGKASILIDGETGKGKWSVEEGELILNVSGEEMVGVLGEDTISFDDMLGMGIKFIFGKEGTDAANPELYLTEEESVVVGEWMSESVEELLGDGPQTTMEGVADIHDALRLNFQTDRSVVVTYKGQEVGTFPWSVAIGYCSIESEDPSLYVTINDDGTLDVDYSTEEDYFTFHCVKNATETE